MSFTDEEQLMLEMLLETPILIGPGLRASQVAQGLAERDLVKIRNHGQEMKWLYITDTGRSRLLELGVPR